MYQKDIAIIHVYASNNKTPMYMKQKLTKSKGDINNSNTVGGNFSAQISIKNRTTRKTTNKEIHLSNTIKQLDQQTLTERSTFSRVHILLKDQWTVLQDWHVLGSKISLNKCKGIGIMQIVFSGCNEVKLENNNGKNVSKPKYVGCRHCT